MPAEEGVMSMLKLEERPCETKIHKPSERITKAKRFRTLARGYKVLKKDKAAAFEAAAAALESVEQLSDRRRQ
jgi:hypothetical protein